MRGKAEAYFKNHEIESQLNHRASIIMNKVWFIKTAVLARTPDGHFNLDFREYLLKPE